MEGSREESRDDRREGKIEGSREDRKGAAWKATCPTVDSMDGRRVTTWKAARKTGKVEGMRTQHASCVYREEELLLEGG